MALPTLPRRALLLFYPQTCPGCECSCLSIPWACLPVWPCLPPCCLTACLVRHRLPYYPLLPHACPCFSRHFFTYLGAPPPLALPRTRPPLTPRTPCLPAPCLPFPTDSSNVWELPLHCSFLPLALPWEGAALGGGDGEEGLAQEEVPRDMFCLGTPSVPHLTFDLESTCSHPSKVMCSHAFEEGGRTWEDGGDCDVRPPLERRQAGRLTPSSSYRLTSGCLPAPRCLPARLETPGSSCPLH